MSEIYLNGFDDEADVLRRYEAPAAALKDATVLFAWYEYENYEGASLVVFQKDGKLWEVNGGHCSCYGLEGQWKPEETSIEALVLRKFPAVAELKTVLEKLR